MPSASRGGAVPYPSSAFPLAKIPRCGDSGATPKTKELSKITGVPRVEGTLQMLQWNARLTAILVFVVLVAAMVGFLHGAGDGRQFGW